MKIKQLFRKRIKMLQPVVAFNERAEIIYGRYDVYNELNPDGNNHVVCDHRGFFHDCYAVRKITEEQYIQHISRLR